MAKSRPKCCQVAKI